MRVLIVVSCLAAYASGQTTCAVADHDCSLHANDRSDDTDCGSTASDCTDEKCCIVSPALTYTCGDIDGLNTPTAFSGCDGLDAKDGATSCAESGCSKAECCEPAALTCDNPDGLGATAFACGTLDAKDGATGCSVSGCSKAECCEPGPEACDDADGLGDGVEFDCDGRNKDPKDCGADGCSIAECCSAGPKTCLDKDGLGGGAFQCTDPEVPGGTHGVDGTSAGQACAGDCTDAECCSAGAKTCANPTGTKVAVAFADCGGLDAKDGATSCAESGCSKAECCEPAALTCADPDGLGATAFACGGLAAKDGATGCSVSGCSKAECCEPAALTCADPDGLGATAFAGCGGLAAKDGATACAVSGCSKAECCEPGDKTCADKDGLGGGAYECTDPAVAGGTHGAGGASDGQACDGDNCTDAECCTAAESKDDDSEAGRVMPVLVTALVVAMAIF